MSTITAHRSPLVVPTGDWALSSQPDAALNDPAFMAAAGRASRLLPQAAHDALVAFTDAPDPSGAMLLQGVPIGALPPTPPSPTAPTGKDLWTEFLLLTVARRLGQPVGYLPEHGGDLVQNIVPTPTAADRQVSTSSKVELMFHTEAAFHPHRPRYLLLLCLRGNPEAHTTLSSIQQVLPLLPADVVDTLFQPRFRTAVDESYLAGRSNVLGPAMAVLTGRRDTPSMIFDADLMVGIDAEADDALRALADVTARHHTSAVLQPGDLLVVDNNVAVHGRSPFTPRFDGSDRWLQRTFVVTDLAASAGERDGRVITTRFGD